MDYLSNAKATVAIDPAEKKFSGRDLTDPHNEPSFYSTSKRSFKKAEAALRAGWTPELTMYQAERILNAAGIGTHTYCAMD